MASVIPDIVEGWGTTPATSNVNMGGYSISGVSNIDASGQVSGGTVVANGNVKLSSDAWGARVFTTNVGNLGIGTAGLSNSIQIGATGNVGIKKTASVALDVEGQVASTSLTTGALTLTGDAVTRHINPETTNSYYCGDPSYRWASTYTKDLDVAGTAKVGANGSTIASTRSFRATLGSGATGVNVFTISYGVTYPDATKLVVIVTPFNDTGAGDTFTCTLQTVGTSACVFNIWRTDVSGGGWGNPLKAHVVITQLQ